MTPLFVLKVSINKNCEIILDREAVNITDLTNLHENNEYCLPIVELKQLMSMLHEKAAEVEQEIRKL
jgi:hypothetical protein